MWRTDKSQEHCTECRTKQRDILCTLSQLVKCQFRYIRKKSNYVTCTWNGGSSLDDFENTLEWRRLGEGVLIRPQKVDWISDSLIRQGGRQRAQRESFLIFFNLLLWWEIVVLQNNFKFCIIKLYPINKSHLEFLDKDVPCNAIVYIQVEMSQFSHHPK